MFEKLTERDNFILSFFPGGASFGNLETMSVAGTDHLSSQ
jgi:hypothetical protein